ncbi:MAG: triose-phosphate isomerase [Candidatus Paceibacterota bacterium]
MAKHSPIVIGNWKMNPESVESALSIFRAVREELEGVSGVDVVVCPSFVHLPPIARERGKARKIGLGAQDVFYNQSGSFTGEVSVPMLKEIGVSHVILGHSERRAMGESDETVARKAVFVLKADLDAVVCVGEHERDEEGAYLKWLENQINSSLEGVSGKYLGQLTIAYEPIWAIGAKEAMESTAIHEMVVFIRRTLARKYGQRSALRPRIIYGGSVNADNIEGIMENGEVDGVLPGRASREPRPFGRIVKAVKKIAAQRSK